MLMIFVTIITGITIFFLYNNFLDFKLIRTKLEIVQTVIGTFTTAMIAFLGAIVILVFSHPCSYFMRVYKDKGYLGFYIFTYLFIIVSLLTNYVFSIICQYDEVLLKIFLTVSSVNILQIVFITVLTFIISSKNP